LVAVHAGPADLGRIYDRLGLFVGMADNFIKPWLIGFGIQMPMLLTTLGVFGGFIAFGFLGLFIGPTLIAIMLILLQACHLSGRSFDFTDIEIRRFVSLLKQTYAHYRCPDWVTGGKPRSEHISPGCPPIADLCRRVAVPQERVKPVMAALETKTDVG
jgi:hypothetical protein